MGLLLIGLNPKNMNDKSQISIKEISYHKNGFLHKKNYPAQLLFSGNDDNKIILSKSYYKNGKKHRNDDKPAVISFPNCYEYYKEGLLYGDGDNPAVLEDRFSKYYKEGLLRRDGDLPAIIHKNGSVEYYKYGIPYRIEGLPVKANKHYRRIYMDP